MTIDQVLAGEAPWVVVHGDCKAVMKGLPENSVDAIVTDAPYGLAFMGKEWDKLDVPKPGNLGGFADGTKPSFERVQRHLPAMQEWHEAWAVAALRVLKPGGHLLSFGGTRTFHRLACALEDAGFEVRDCLMWIFGSGFPKSKNLNGDWQGWGTALKPGWEPILLARKPLSEPNVAANMSTWSVGALNVDGCRINGSGPSPSAEYRKKGNAPSSCKPGAYGHTIQNRITPERWLEERPGEQIGRWPANVILDEAAAQLLDDQSGDLTSGGCPSRRSAPKFRNTYGTFQGQTECVAARGADWGGASRFFYCAKVGRAERNAGLEGFAEKPLHWTSGDQNPGSFQSAGTKKTAPNGHPTVKPVALMRWLVRLVTPAGGVVLDPFAGSGTTGIACAREEVRFIGIEQEVEYVAIAEARIRHAYGPLLARVPHAD